MLGKIIGAGPGREPAGGGRADRRAVRRGAARRPGRRRRSCWPGRTGRCGRWPPAVRRAPQARRAGGRRPGDPVEPRAELHRADRPAAPRVPPARAAGPARLRLVAGGAAARRVRSRTPRTSSSNSSTCGSWTSPASTRIGRVRYRCHDLVQLFGAEQAAARARRGGAAAVARTLAIWMALVEAGARRLPRVTLGLARRRRRPSTSIPRLVEEAADDPTEWLTSETAAVVRVVERGARAGHRRADHPLITVAAVLAVRRPQRVRRLAAHPRGRPRRGPRGPATGGRRRRCSPVSASCTTRRTTSPPRSTTSSGRSTRPRPSATSRSRPWRWSASAPSSRDLAEFDAAPPRTWTAAVSSANGSATDSVVGAAANYGLGAISRDHGDIDAATEQLTTLRRAVPRDRRPPGRGAGVARAEPVPPRAATSTPRPPSSAAQATAILSDGRRRRSARPTRGSRRPRRRCGSAGTTGVTGALAECLDTCTRTRTGSASRW